MQLHPVPDDFGRQEISLDNLPGHENADHHGNGNIIRPELAKGGHSRSDKARQGADKGNETQQTGPKSNEQSMVQTRQRKR